MLVFYQEVQCGLNYSLYIKTLIELHSVMSLSHISYLRLSNVNSMDNYVTQNSLQQVGVFNVYWILIQSSLCY
jgi:hypothetical protein